jgi:hypothetical protein
MTLIEAAKLALEALTQEKWFRIGLMEENDPKVEAAIAALDAAIEAAEKREPVAWPCEIEEADFEQDTITLKMLTSQYVVRAGKHWLSTIPPAQPPQRTEQEPVSQYYDTQLSEQERKEIAARGLEPLVFNRIVPPAQSMLQPDAFLQNGMLNPKYTTPPAQPAQQEPMGREAYMAIREARENASEDAYFAARPEHDKDLNRVMFRFGFYRGYANTPPAQPAPEFECPRCGHCCPQR